MADELFYIPSPRADGYVELARTPKGKLFRKMILPMGSFVHPNNPKTRITVTPEMAQQLKDNFDAGYCDSVQIPIVNDDNKHVEDPLRNAGEVIDIDYDERGVYATIDARKHADEFGSTILGASAFMHLNYTDTKTGNHVGPTLLHVAATNRPYVTNMDGYEEIIAASADIQDEKPVLLVQESDDDKNLRLSHESTEDGPMATKDELLAALKEEHGIDVEALQAQAAGAAELSAQLEDVNAQLQLSGGSAIDASDLANALVELSADVKDKGEKIAALEADREAMRLSAATAEVESLVKAGRVLPKQKEAMISLSLSDREMFDSIVPDNAVVTLSEHGVLVHEQPDNDEARNERISKYAAIGDAIRGSGKSKNR